MLVGTKEIVKITGLSEYTIRRMVKTGFIPSIDTSAFTGTRGRLLFNPETVKASLEARAEEKRAEQKKKADMMTKWMQ